jgi:large conductance mechanosensitive channel
MASVLKAFKDFLMRGNLIELAVAFVMGLAFAAVVNSLVTNLVMPIIAAIIGKPDFRDLTFTIHKSVFRYGSFITDVIQFVAIAAAVFFFIVKPVQLALARRRGRDAEEEAPSDEERRHQELIAAVRGLRA